MFGARRRGPSSVRTMQIFHELKQQFPAVPDHVVTACIASHVQASAARGTTHPADGQMGHQPPAARDDAMHQPAHPAGDVAVTGNPPARRPTTLPLQPEPFNGRLQLSEKCRNVHQLLNSPNKPPRPPRNFSKTSPTAAKDLLIKKPTASTPTQTTDTLVGQSPSVNLSLNVNVVQCEASPKCTTKLQVTPAQPWLNPFPAMDQTSPRSFTSVNLTLRPPTSAPQDPIDITSQNSSLTYSTSSFDRQRGLQSRLQITVRPGGGSAASSMVRPNSSYIPEEEDEVRPEVPVRAGSLNNLSLAGKSEAPVLMKQQARIERMRIELQTEKTKLVIMKEEVAKLERNRLQLERLTDVEVEKQLIMEINHLRCQCEQLARAAEKGQFYNNIYTGPTGPLVQREAAARADAQHRREAPPRRRAPHHDPDGPRWSCHLCTFLNHPDLAKCEQCEMPRVVHGTQRRPWGRPGAFPASGIALDMLGSVAEVPLAALNFDVRRPAASARSLSLTGVGHGGASAQHAIQNSSSTPSMFNLG